jgi:hypothetical protein
MAKCRISWGPYSVNGRGGDVISDNAEFTNKLLQDILDDDCAIYITISGPLVGVNYGLLHDVFVTSYHVTLFRTEWFAVSMLCDALKHRDCQITNVWIDPDAMQYINKQQLAHAFKRNNSLRVVCGVNLEMLRLVVHSTTVETLWLQVTRDEMLLEDWSAMFEMPALCDIRIFADTLWSAAYRAGRNKWPDRVCPVFWGA